MAVVKSRLWANLTAVALVATAVSGCAPSQTQPLDVAVLADKTSSFQRAILEDGKVSFSEYEKAVLSARDCIKSAGGEVSEVEPRPGNQLGFDTTVESQGDSERQRIGDSIRNCNVEYLFDVAKVWSYQEMLSPAEKEAVKPQVIECLNDAGLSLKKSSGDSEIQSALESTASEDQRKAVIACVQKFPEYFQTVPQNE